MFIPESFYSKLVRLEVLITARFTALKKGFYSKLVRLEEIKHKRVSQVPYVFLFQTGSIRSVCGSL